MEQPVVCQRHDDETLCASMPEEPELTNVGQSMLQRAVSYSGSFSARKYDVMTSWVAFICSVFPVERIPILRTSTQSLPPRPGTFAIFCQVVAVNEFNKLCTVVAQPRRDTIQ